MGRRLGCAGWVGLEGGNLTEPLYFRAALTPAALSFGVSPFLESLETGDYVDLCAQGWSIVSLNTVEMLVDAV